MVADFFTDWKDLRHLEDLTLRCFQQEDDKCQDDHFPLPSVRVTAHAAAKKDRRREVHEFKV